MDHFPGNWGNPRELISGNPDRLGFEHCSIAAAAGPITHTQ